MTITSLPRCLIVLACLLAAAASPAVAEEDAGVGAAQMAELKREANAAAARYHQAENELARLKEEVAGLNTEIEALEARMGRLREAGTRGAALLYMRDSMVDSVAGLGDGSQILRSARRSKLVGNVAELAGVALGDLDRGLRELEDRRQSLEGRRGEQGAVVAQLKAERRDIGRRLAAMARAERQRQAQERAAARAAAAPTRQAQAVPALPALPAPPGSFVCPIKGPVAYSNDFGGRRRHRGNDLMNPRGTENVAVVSGTASTRRWGGGAGITLFLHGDDGNLYIYMHLLRFVGPLPRHVEQGEVVALTGATGNATAYHTHFEFHPGGGPAVNPYPLIAAHC